MDWKLSAAVGGILGSALTALVFLSVVTKQDQILDELRLVRSAISRVAKPECVENRNVYEFRMHNLSLPDTGTAPLLVHGCTLVSQFEGEAQQAAEDWLKRVIEQEASQDE